MTAIRSMRSNRLGSPLGWALLLAAIGSTPFLTGSLRLNLTSSLPLGMYRLEPLVGPVQGGDLVAACLPASIARTALLYGYLRSGSCDQGAAPLLKRVGAVAGDAIAITGAGIVVNGRLLPGTAPLPTDHAGRAIAVARFPPAVPHGLVLLYADGNPASWDGRYFGLVPEASVIAVARVVWCNCSEVRKVGPHA